MKNIETRIVIKSDAKSIWKELTDFQKYSSWNPFITKSAGDFQVGGVLENTISLNGKDNFFKPVVKEIIENKTFRWLGKAPLGIFNGEHYFILNERQDGSTELVHGENFTGWLSSIILNRIGEDTRNGFEAMNRALQHRVEKR